MCCIFGNNCKIMLLNTHIFTYCMLCALAWPACDCDLTKHQCTVSAKWTLSRTEDRYVREKVLNESSLRPPGQPQEQMFMVFISLHVCLHDISLYMCMCQSTVLHPLLELIPQLARRRSRRMKLNVCILHAYLHSDYISAVSMTPWEPLK